MREREKPIGAAVAGSEGSGSLVEPLLDLDSDDALSDLMGSDSEVRRRGLGLMMVMVVGGDCDRDGGVIVVAVVRCC